MFESSKIKSICKSICKCFRGSNSFCIVPCRQKLVPAKCTKIYYLVFFLAKVGLLLISFSGKKWSHFGLLFVNFWSPKNLGTLFVCYTETLNLKSWGRYYQTKILVWRHKSIIVMVSKIIDLRCYQEIYYYYSRWYIIVSVVYPTLNCWFPGLMHNDRNSNTNFLNNITCGM